MEYLVDRYDERTRQAFSWTTIFFQLFMGASMLYGLGLSWPDLRLALVGDRRLGAVILAYCVIAGSGRRHHRLPAGRHPHALHDRDGRRSLAQVGGSPGS